MSDTYLERVFREKDDDELLRIASTSSGQYTEEAIHLAIKELTFRGVYQGSASSRMKFCPQCLTEYREGFLKCISCKTDLVCNPLQEHGELSLSYHTVLLGDKFPTLFLPIDGFYDDWDGSEEHLNRRLRSILTWLHCGKDEIAAFYSDSVEGGRYIVNKNGGRVILIEKHISIDSMLSVSILAHESVHHFMHKHAYSIDDDKLNELKTDIFTICTGLGILRINGMEYAKGAISYEQRVRRTALRQLTFANIGLTKGLGYFNGYQYCEYFEKYLEMKGISGSDVIGFIHPLARHFISSKLAACRPTKELTIVKKLNRLVNRNRMIKRTVPIIGICALLLYFFAPKLLPSPFDMYIVAAGSALFIILWILGICAHFAPKAVGKLFSFVWTLTWGKADVPMKNRANDPTLPWYRYTSENGAYMVEFPSQAMELKDSGMVVARDTVGNNYACQKVKLTNGDYDGQTSKDMLVAAVKALVLKKNVTLTETVYSVHGGEYVSVDFTGSTKNPNHIFKGRIILENKQLFYLFAILQDETAFSMDSCHKFINSFQFLTLHP